MSLLIHACFWSSAWIPIEKFTFDITFLFMLLSNVLKNQSHWFGSTAGPEADRTSVGSDISPTAIRGWDMLARVDHSFQQQTFST